MGRQQRILTMTSGTTSDGIPAHIVPCRANGPAAVTLRGDNAMSPQGSRQVVDRYIKGLVDRNLDLQAEVSHPT